MERFTNLNELKNERDTMQFIKSEISRIIYNYFCSNYGEEFCRLIPKKITITENESDVSANTVVVDVGDITNKDGFTVGACCEIIVRVKKWNTALRKNGGKQFAISLDDYDEGIANARED